MEKETTLSRLGLRLALIVGVMVFVTVFAFVWWRINLNYKVESQLGKIRAARLPVSGAGINDWLPAVPDAENGALVMPQAFALLRNFPDGRSNEVAAPHLLDTIDGWPPRLMGLVNEYVQTNGAALAKAHEALGLSKFRYAVNFSYGPETPLPHLQSLKALARLEALRAALSAGAGQSNVWPDAVESQLRIAETLDTEPAVISQLVRTAILRMAVDTTEQSLAHASVSDREAEKLAIALNQSAKANLFSRALIGERAMSIPIFRLTLEEATQLSHASEDPGEVQKLHRYSGRGTALSSLTGFFERDLNFFLDTMDHAIKALGQPPPECLKLTNYFASASQTAHDKFYIYSSMVLPTFSSLSVTETSSFAHLKLAATALAVERFRHGENRLPDHLEELLPNFLNAMPTDPFNDAPLHYQRLAHGYMIYSIGVDGHFKTKKPGSKKATNTIPYIAFTVGR